ncbi:hypothetical protein KI387_008276, partial [Taxus chinensis]
MEGHVEDVFEEDFVVAVTEVEDKVSSHEELVRIVDLQSITNVSSLICYNSHGAERRK